MGGRAPGPEPGWAKYVICNADEGDPGAFMDRGLLESDPHQVIEGMIICGYSVGATRATFYIRAEYPTAVQRVETALRQAREKGLLGENILGSGYSFDLEVFQGSGAFVCGEATALVESMEGRMGIPQTRPPRLAEAGLRGCPTVLNNVKTFAYVPLIIRNGVAWFKESGTAGSPGTAFSPWWGRWRIQAWWRCPWAPRCAIWSLMWARAWPAESGSRRSRSAVPPAAACPSQPSICPLILIPCAKRGLSWAPAAWWSSMKTTAWWR